MIAELITPLMLATAPMTITVEPLSYSHSKQSVAVLSAKPGEWSTNGATRTYDSNGRPLDSDND